ncbi:MAG: 23S rRNA (guanosine(2251)-2'-O)-methyltransferase RlmB [Clostridia bacterium]|nr:23S rRNA (guanosine(2251)-2'-O)-methyltransferase RlmB [Clostridia bacterium]
MENFKRKDKNTGRKAKDTERYNKGSERLAEEIPSNYVAGRNAVGELLSGGKDIEKIFVQSGEREGSINMLIGKARERKIPIIEIDKARLDRMMPGVRHQGIIAAASEAEYSTVADILAYAEELGEAPFVVLLDGVEDPHNLGAIIRSAECMGAHGIIIPKRRAVGLTATVAKASAGAIMHMRVAKVTNLSVTIDELKEKGLWIYGADMGGASVYETDTSGAIGLVLGSEGDGISRLVREKCDHIISIPMFGKVNSMNVSCAAAVLLANIANRRKGG